MDRDFGDALHAFSNALSKSHGALRRALKFGKTKAVIDRLRSGDLSPEEANEIADLLEGRREKLPKGRGRDYDPNVMKQILVARVAEMKVKFKGRKPRKTHADILEAVVKEWNKPLVPMIEVTDHVAPGRAMDKVASEKANRTARKWTEPTLIADYYPVDGTRPKLKIKQLDEWCRNPKRVLKK